MPLRLGQEARERPPVLDGNRPDLTVENSQWKRDWHCPMGSLGSPFALMSMTWGIVPGDISLDGLSGSAEGRLFHGKGRLWH